MCEWCVRSTNDGIKDVQLLSVDRLFKLSTQNQAWLTATQYIISIPIPHLLPLLLRTILSTCTADDPMNMHHVNRKALIEPLLLPSSAASFHLDNLNRVG